MRAGRAFDRIHDTSQTAQAVVAVGRLLSRCGNLGKQAAGLVVDELGGAAVGRDAGQIRIVRHGRIDRDRGNLAMRVVSRVGTLDVGARGGAAIGRRRGRRHQCRNGGGGFAAGQVARGDGLRRVAQGADPLPLRVIAVFGELARRGHDVAQQAGRA